MARYVRRETVAASPTGSPGPSASSVASGVMGIVLLVIAIVALARGGVSTLTTPVVTVGPFSLTPLFALIQMGLGAIALATAAERDVRGASALAVVTGVAGIVWLIEPAAFAGLLGAGSSTGGLYVTIAIALLVGVALDRRGHRAV